MMTRSEKGALSILIPALLLLTSARECPGTDPVRVAEQWLRHIRRSYRPVFSLKADVTQELIRSTHPAPLVARGTLEMKRKQGIRLTFESPKRSVLLSNGISSWFYAKERRIAYALPETQTQRWHGFLENLLEKGAWTDFDIALLGGEGSPAEAVTPAVLRFTPREEIPEVRSIFVTVQEEMPCIRRVMVRTGATQLIRITLHNIRLNTGISSGRFAFSPKKQVRIIVQ